MATSKFRIVSMAGGSSLATGEGATGPEAERGRESRALGASFRALVFGASLAIGSIASPAWAAICATNADCSDGVFCNGQETCDAGSCSASPGDPCAGGPACANTCNEEASNCFAAADTNCGDAGTQCTNQDKCDGSGTCTDNGFVAADTNCGDAGTQCTNQDKCDGSGTCTDNGFVAADTNCGDAGTQCTNQDKCDGSGTCTDNGFVAADTNCGDAGTQCTNQDKCDGSGTCTDNGFVAADTNCGDAGTQCTNQDKCDGSGTCTDNGFVAADTNCGDAGTQCTNQDKCDGSGTCTDNGFVAADTNCGDAGTQCTNQDKCDGSGTCMDNGFVAADTNCGDAGTQCTNQDKCDGSGTCTDNGFVAADTNCGDAGTQCTNQDKCDGSGTCTDNGFVAASTACGSASDTECDNPDTCNGSGTCQPNHEPLDVNCGDAGTQCTNQDKCDGTGSCTDKGFKTDTTHCTGASQGAICDKDANDHCSGTNDTCVDVFQATTVVCRSDAGQCDVAETCNGSNAVCPGDSFEADTIHCTGASQGAICDKDANDHCSGTANNCVDVFQANTVVCRADAGQCDVAETCNGSNAVCPGDSFEADTIHCTGDSQGAICDKDSADHCVGTSNSCVDVFQANTVVCRADTGQCDVAETCNGSNAVCPGDSFEADTIHCTGASQGAICDKDANDHCSGTADSCVDVFQPNTVVCRADAGQCDVAETCNGSNAVCPGDSFEPNTLHCTGGSQGAICDKDIDDHCVGTANSCVDVFQANTVVCRSIAGQCDVAETCTGSTAICPGDSFKSDTTHCTGVSQGAICDKDIDDHCIGTANSCVDVFQANTVVCRSIAGQCDVAETCTGSAAICPGDSFKSDTTHCTGASQGAICDKDIDDHCVGTANSCVDVFQANTVVCRSIAGICDVAENCTGSNAICPGDSFKATTTTCRASAGICDVAENCTGSAAACPGNAFQPSSHVCRSLGDGGTAPACDLIETCTGSAAACPPNLFKVNDTVCDDGNSSTALSACQKGYCLGQLAPGETCSASSLQCGVPVDTDSCVQAGYAYCRKLPSGSSAECVVAPDETQPKPTCEDSPTAAECAASSGSSCSTNGDCDSGLCSNQTCTPITTNQACTCGDANFDGVVKTSDALLVLKKAVGQPIPCPLCACDVQNRDKREVLSSDAQLILKNAVGQEAGRLTCGSCFHCFNGVKDENIDVPETDIDCGGSAEVGGCEPCRAGRKCDINADCVSDECSGGKCFGHIGEACSQNADCDGGLKCSEASSPQSPLVCYQPYGLTVSSSSDAFIFTLKFTVDLDNALDLDLSHTSCVTAQSGIGGQPTLTPNQSPEIDAKLTAFSGVKPQAVITCSGIRQVNPAAVKATVVGNIVAKDQNGSDVALTLTPTLSPGP